MDGRNSDFRAWHLLGPPTLSEDSKLETFRQEPPLAFEGCAAGGIVFFVMYPNDVVACFYNYGGLNLYFGPHDSQKIQKALGVHFAESR